MVCFTRIFRKDADTHIPEGPELLHSRDLLREILLNKRFKNLQVVGGRYTKKPIQGFDKFVEDNEKNFYPIDSIDVKGKFMWWTIGPWKLWCTYGMSGQWTTSAPDRNTAVVVTIDSLSGGCTDISFHDPRRFGTLKFVKSEKEHEKKLESLGPDVLNDDSLTSEIFAKRMLSKPNRTICEALMDQSIISGIGNYLRAEILFACKLDPWCSVTDVTAQEYMLLFEKSKKISQQSYVSQGASIKTYRDVNGGRGSTQFSFKMYGKKRCPKEHPTESKRDSCGRTVHWCSQCQTPR